MIGQSGRCRQVVIYNQSELAGIRKAAQATAGVLQQLTQALRPGLSTWELDALAGRLILATGGTSAFHGYRGFPGQVCISRNDEVVHGIGRKEHIIEAGDLVSIDVGIRLHGYIGDTATTYCVGGAVTEPQRHLMETTRHCLELGIEAAQAGRRVRDIGRVIEQHARAEGFSVVRDFVGHGCGRQLHEPPEVPNFAGSRPGAKLQNGMVLAIEPMLNQGTGEIIVDSDGWTVRTRDRKLSAHFEHMIAINNGSAEILTWPRKV